MVSKAVSKINYKKLLILALCFVLYFVLTNISTPDGLTENGQKAIALMIVAIVLWVSEIIPIGVSSILLLVMPEVLGIVPMPESLSHFMIPTVIFIYAAFIIAQALTGSGLEIEFLGSKFSIWYETRSGFIKFHASYRSHIVGIVRHSNSFDIWWFSLFAIAEK